MFNLESSIKTLGIAWQPATDMFIFNPSESKPLEIWTKRKVLSEISKLFDPLGWMAPFVIKAKVLMQRICQHEKCNNWNDELPSDLLGQWIDIFEQMKQPIPVQVPRWIGLSNDMVKVELRCFADASTRAYCSAIYLRVVLMNGQIKCTLVAAKTKVAPQNPLITIPRLELCAAVLLKRLQKRVLIGLQLENYSVHAWSDSKICFSWLATQPSKWSVFVAHRVSEIQKELPFSQWAFVSTSENPR